MHTSINDTPNITNLISSQSTNLIGRQATYMIGNLRGMLKDRFKAARLHKMLNQEALAEKSGMSQQGINAIENGDSSRPRKLPALAGILGVSEEWLLFGTNPPEWFAGQSPGTRSEPITKPGRRAPILSWDHVSAINRNDLVEEAHQDPDTQWIYTSKTIGQHAFGLRVIGDSMTNPGGWPSIPEGALLLVDPEYPAKSGDLVIARASTDGQPTFKKLVIDAGVTFLKPLHPAYPAIQATAVEIIGTVRDAVIQLT